ncbi:MAG: AraC family transcriptional regulator [Bacteroidales bacterium]|nr:AraC family transcriptional regulator [Bacteroidales bacterium]
MNSKSIKEISFNCIPNWLDVDYMDNDLILHSDMCELPFKDEVLKVDMVIVIACLKGKMQLNVNSRQFQVCRNDVLIIHPNSYLGNVLAAPDFACNIMCLSTRIVTDFIPENKLWNKIHMLSAYPIIHVNNDSILSFEMYMKLLDLKLKTPYSDLKKDILCSIIRTCMYELLERINQAEHASVEFNRKNILFKNFIKLLSGIDVKPRNISWYSEKLFVTPKYLSTVCKEISGKTAFSWINEYVINDIKHILMDSDKSIKEISDYYNFPNCSFFGKYFKQHTGCSPREYRKQIITAV